jgi:hypothetical protein
MSHKPRHTRQVRLAEIGEVGQERIEATTAYVDDEGIAGTLEARYLAGAGVGKIATASPGIADAARAVDPNVHLIEGARVRLGHGEPPPFGIKDPVALEVARGAWRALAHVRRAVRRGSNSDSSELKVAKESGT